MPDFIFLSRFVSIDQRFSESVEGKEDSLLAGREVTGKLLLIAWLDVEGYQPQALLTVDEITSAIKGYHLTLKILQSKFSS